jgi:DNA ligase-1
VEIAVAWLSGEIRQGRIGVGWSALSTLRGRVSASTPSLTLREVDTALADIATTAGKGSAGGAQRPAAGALRPGHRRRAGLPRAAPRRRAAPGRARRRDARRDRRGVGPARGRRARAAMLTGSLRETRRAAMGSDGAARSRASRSACIGRCSRCSRRPRTTSPRRWRSSAPPRSNGRSMAPGSRRTRRATRSPVYTRALKDVTDSVPEIVEAVRALPARELILDGEAIALAPDGTPLPFQVTMRRFGRKLDVEAMRAELPLAAYFFDCLHLDGASLLDRPAQERFDALAAALPPRS